MSAPAGTAVHDHDDIIYPDSLPFMLIHLAAFAAIWTGVTWQALVVCVVLYVVRMFGVTAGYHRYFSHRTFRTSRVGQFLLAFLAQSSAQRGVLWWAAKHRHHHRYSDTELDVHSPRQHGFWYAHLGWILKPQHEATDYDAVPDLTRYPELVWLDRHQYLPATVLGVAVWLLFGWSGLVVGFVWSTLLLYHGTFMINSLAHVHGSVRYVTGDDSRNNWWLAILTLGEGWHNNHHAYQRSTRQGFRWYEYDPTFYALTVLSWLGVVWDLGEPPADVVRNERPLGRAVVEKVARQLAASIPADEIAARLREAWLQSPKRAELLELRAQVEARLAQLHVPTQEELKARGDELRAQLAARLEQMSLPHLPSADDLRARAQAMYAQSPSMDEIVARARALVAQAVSSRLLEQGARA